MKIELDLMPDHWWIEKREPYNKPDVTCAAMVHFKSADGKHEVKKEEQFRSVDEACAWVKEQLA